MGAFTVYAGVDAGEDESCLHHQLVLRRPLGEGNSVFASISPGWDSTRAPQGRVALTLSTHTALAPWLDLRRRDVAAYESRKHSFAQQLLECVKAALPRAFGATRLVLAGTPATFEDFTLRKDGWVGGFEQTSLQAGLAPRAMPGLWLVGDSIFPGQSVAATALGGLRVARQVHADYSSSSSMSRSNSSILPTSSSISRSMP